MIDDVTFSSGELKDHFIITLCDCVMKAITLNVTESFS